MKYFEVHKYEITGQELCSRVYSDGESINEPEETMDISTRVLGFMVSEMDEDGLVGDTRWYAVHDGGEAEGVERVLEEIKSDYPAEEWENLEW